MGKKRFALIEILLKSGEGGRLRACRQRSIKIRSAHYQVNMCTLQSGDIGYVQLTVIATQLRRYGSKLIMGSALLHHWWIHDTEAH